MTLEILIATMESGLNDIAGMLLPCRKDFLYLVSCQYAEKLPAVPQELASRKDVRVVFLQGRGLSRNRNNALKYAVGDVLLMADDDGCFYEDGLEEILGIYQRFPEVDVALFKVDGMKKFYPDADFCLTEKDFRGAYYTASVEMSMRRCSVDRISFNPSFGLGSEYLSAGEEQVFLKDALDEGLHVHWFPVCIGRTAPVTTGEKFLTDERVQRSKGATFFYLFGSCTSLWLCLKEVAYYLLRRRVNPFVILKNMCNGIAYARRLSKSVSGRTSKNI